MNKLRIGLKAMVAVAIISAVFLVAPTIGRFTPTHFIIQDVYCGSCHPEQVSELGSSGAHLAHFASQVNSTYTTLTNGTSSLSAAMAITDGCTMCHNYWDNMEWFGVNNFNLSPVMFTNPAPITDIYGNAISPYGLSSTTGFVFSIGGPKNSANAGLANTGVEPWDAGLGVYQYTNATGVTKTRVDYIWSALSAISPGPAFFNSTGGNASAQGGCGTAEKGLCHIAQNSVAIAEFGARPEFPNNGSNGTAPIKTSGSGVFFRHEMAFTTAQYAAKPVKLCGACHVFKLPPMVWGGEPWSAKVVQLASLNNGTILDNGRLPQTMPNGDPGDPFGFTPLYPVAGSINISYTGHNQTFNIAYKAPDWAHANVPCIRCHTHAGVNGVGVSDNTITVNPGI